MERLVLGSSHLFVSLSAAAANLLIGEAGFLGGSQRTRFDQQTVRLKRTTTAESLLSCFALRVNAASPAGRKTR